VELEDWGLGGLGAGGLWSWRAGGLGAKGCGAGWAWKVELGL